MWACKELLNMYMNTFRVQQHLVQCRYMYSTVHVDTQPRSQASDREEEWAWFPLLCMHLHVIKVIPPSTNKHASYTCIYMYMLVMSKQIHVTNVAWSVQMHVVSQSVEPSLCSKLGGYHTACCYNRSRPCSLLCPPAVRLS